MSTRRRFLQMGGAALGALTLLRHQRGLAQACEAPPQPPEVPLYGRVERFDQPVYKSLGDRRPGNVARLLGYHEVVPVLAAVAADPPGQFPHNPIYYETPNGWVHSSLVVPCGFAINPPEEQIGGGFWAEVTVPLTHHRPAPQQAAPARDPLRWGTVYRVTERQDDACGQAWYRIQDDVYPHQPWWVPAPHLRRITPAQVAPISPHVPPQAKRIAVSIGTQTLTCYEADQPVFSTRLSSGGVYFSASGDAHPYPTPWGRHYVQRKTPARHMIGGQEIGAPYDLPGVPWCTYFAATGEAIHGATTHNNFGQPMSHGCLNVTPDAARWVYRWAAPSVPYDEAFYWLPADQIAQATPVEISA